MPIVLTIKDNSDKDSRQLGDVVCIYPDDHPISKKEQQLYIVENITDEQAAEYHALSAREKTAFKAQSTDWSFDFPTASRVWQDDEGDWYEVSKVPLMSKKFINGKFELNYDREAGNKAKVLVAKKPGQGQGKN